MSDLNTFKQLSEMKKARECFVKVYPNGDLTGACTLTKTDKPSIHFIEAPENWLSLIGKLETAIEALEEIETESKTGDETMTELCCHYLSKDALKKIVGEK